MCDCCSIDIAEWVTYASNKNGKKRLRHWVEIHFPPTLDVRCFLLTNYLERR